MYFFLTVPILVINLVLCSMAMYDVYKHYTFTTFKPRLVMVSILILSDLPYSILFIFPDIIDNGFLTNSTLCYFYHAVANFYTLKYLALITLTILISCIIFTNYTVRRLNKIGWGLNIAVLIGFLIIELIVLPLGKAVPIDFPKDDTAKKFPKRCIALEKVAYEGISYLQTTSSITSFTGSIMFIVANTYMAKFKKGTSSYRIALSFLIFSLINTVAMLEWAWAKIAKKEVEGTLKWFLLDISKIVPSLFSITYLMSEAWGRKKNLDFNIRKVLKVKKCRNLYKEYLSDIQAKKGYEFIVKWERISCGVESDEQTYDIIDRNNLNKTEALTYLEKNLELDIYGFLMSEAFNDFYVIYNMGGQVEANLAEGLEEESKGDAHMHAF